MTRVEITPADWKDLNGGLEREWILTNGLGGWASASIFGANTRRYHGLLVAAEKVPTGRIVLLSKIDEELIINGQTYPLGVNEWSSDFVDPHGDKYLTRFVQNYSSVEFHYKVGEYGLTKTVWMAYGYNTTYVKYQLPGADKGETIELALRPFITCKDYHSESKGKPEKSWRVEETADRRSFSYYHPDNPTAPLNLHLEGDKPWRVEPTGYWFWNFYHRTEQERGLDFLEDLYGAQIFRVSLKSGEEVGLTASFGETPDPAISAESQQQRLEQVMQNWPGYGESTRRVLESCLVAAADQFIVARPLVEKVLAAGEKGRTVIAGYHWFTDWGRDTMIALPGLTLSTGRYAEAASILHTFAAYLDMGMLPNRFPDTGEEPEYNTVDATLWFFQAIYAYFQATGDQKLVQELYSKLEEVIDWHTRGTRYKIKVDASDGLLHAGEPGVQLTWMDVKIKDWVVTPRHGKPVEINALWCNALGIMDELGQYVPVRQKVDYGAKYRRACESFRHKFWYKEGGYLYDVIESEDSNNPRLDAEKRDSSLRPNQLLAISLPFAPLSQPEMADFARSIIETCATELLTPVGLRTLNRADPRYIGRFTGDQAHRDEAYHNGTIWPWLLGPFIAAHLKTYGDKARARTYLAPWVTGIKEGGIGTICEVYDGDAPHRPLGCMAQAWSVSEVLRALMLSH